MRININMELQLRVFERPNINGHWIAIVAVEIRLSDTLLRWVGLSLWRTPSFFTQGLQNKRTVVAEFVAKLTSPTRAWNLALSLSLTTEITRSLPFGPVLSSLRPIPRIWPIWLHMGYRLLTEHLDDYLSLEVARRSLSSWLSQNGVLVIFEFSRLRHRPNMDTEENTEQRRSRYSMNRGQDYIVNIISEKEECSIWGIIVRDRETQK